MGNGHNTSMDIDFDFEHDADHEITKVFLDADGRGYNIDPQGITVFDANAQAHVRLTHEEAYQKLFQ